MRKAGITSPNSLDGVGVCLKCELSICVEELYGYDKQRKTTRKKAAKARELEKLGLSIEEIAYLLGKGERQIQRYLNKGMYNDS